MERQHRSISHWRTLPIAVVMALVTMAFVSPILAQEDSITISLREYQRSGVSGSATLTADEQNTRVVMELSGDPVTGNHPTHIHTGTCADFDPDPTYPLTTVILDEVSDEGVSDSTVEDVSLESLLGADYVILVHKSAEELTNYYVCGDIKMSATAEQVPQSGVGIGESNASPMVFSLGVLAVLSAGCALLLRRRGMRG